VYIRYIQKEKGKEKTIAIEDRKSKEVGGNSIVSTISKEFFKENGYILEIHFFRFLDKKKFKQQFKKTKLN